MEVTSTAAAALIVAMALNRLAQYLPGRQDEAEEPDEAAAPVDGAERSEARP
jgi:hypothetical protein